MTRTSLATRFWLGMALPTVMLAVFTLSIALIGGQGRGLAGVVVVILAFAFVPAAMLVNGWALFSSWPAGRLTAAAHVVPVYLVVAVALFVQGAGEERTVGATLLAPVVGLAHVAGMAPLAATAAWLVAMAALVFLARRKQARAGA